LSASRKRVLCPSPQPERIKRQRNHDNHQLGLVKGNTYGHYTTPVFRLPHYFGVDFIKRSIIGKRAKTSRMLSNRFKLSRLSIGGSLVPGGIVDYRGNEPLLVKLTLNPNGGDWKGCYLAIESILLQEVATEARVALLVNLAVLNDQDGCCRTKKGRLVQSRNPFISPSTGTCDLHWMTTVKSGRRTKRDIFVVGFEDAYRHLPRLEQKYPTCRAGVMEMCADHPGVLPHVFLSGPNYDDVYGFQRDLTLAVCDRC
jgi:hypothetical protein